MLTGLRGLGVLFIGPFKPCLLSIISGSYKGMHTVSTHIPCRPATPPISPPPLFFHCQKVHLCTAHGTAWTPVKEAAVRGGSRLPFTSSSLCAAFRRRSREPSALRCSDLSLGVPHPHPLSPITSAPGNQIPPDAQPWDACNSTANVELN